MNDELYGHGEGRSKKEAEQAAAAEALVMLDQPKMSPEPSRRPSEVAGA